MHTRHVHDVKKDICCSESTDLNAHACNVYMVACAVANTRINVHICIHTCASGHLSKATCISKARFKRTTNNLRETTTFPSMSVPSASPTTNKKQKTKPRLHWPDASDKQPSQSCKTGQCKHRCKSAAESGRGGVSEYPVNPTHHLPGHSLASQLSRRPVARSLGANDAPCMTGHSSTPARAAHRERGHEKLSWANAQKNKKT